MVQIRRPSPSPSLACRLAACLPLLAPAAGAAAQPPAAGGGAVPTVDFAAAAAVAAEGDGTVSITLVLSETAAGDVDVPFTLGGSAVQPDDYGVSASPATILAGALSTTIDVTLADDARFELDETVELTLGTPTGATLGATTQHVLTVTDDDPQPSVAFTLAAQSAAEDAGVVQVEVALSAEAGVAVDVPFTVGGTAVDPEDYGVGASPATIPAGALSTTVDVTLVDDARFELDDTVQLDLGAPTHATLGATTQHVLTITDDDPQPNVQLALAAQSAGEAAGVVAIDVQLSAAAGVPVTVHYALSGTASRPDDATVDASPLVIPVGATGAAIDASLVDDLLDEADETVVVTLGTPANASLGSVAEHVLTITDDDAAPTVAFALAAGAAAEGSGPVQVVVELSAESGLAVDVPFTVGGTAEDPADFGVSASPATIPAGALSTTVDVTLVDDALHELDETVQLDLATPTNATLGATAQHVLTIADDDPQPTLAFALAAGDASEADGPVQVLVELSAESGLAVDVPFTVGGTAEDPADFGVSASPATIPAGALSTTVDVTLVDDALHELDETVQLDLATPTNATLGATAQHVLTIADDDPAPTLGFATAGQLAFEPGGTVSVDLVLSAIAGVDVTVSLLSDGTANSPEDFLLLTDPVLVPAGSTQAVALVQIVDDEELEELEIARLFLGLVSGADPGPITEHRIRIADDDQNIDPAPIEQRRPLTVSTSSIAFSATRVGETDERTLVVSNRSTDPISFEGFRAGGPDAASVDLQYASPPPLLLAPGAETTVTVVFAPVEVGPAAARLNVVQRPPAHIAAGRGDVQVRGVGFGPTNAELLVNAGGADHVDLSAQQWVADFGASGGMATASTDPVVGARDPILYQTQRTGAFFGYSWELPAGPYEVVLHFVEPVATAIGERRFDVRIEGVPVLEDLDVFALVGHDVAHSEVVRTTVADGRLDIDFLAASGDPIVSVLEVRSIAVLDPVPGVIDFGVVSQGDAPSQDLTLSNVGLHPLDITSLSLLEAAPDGAGHDFTVTLDGTPYVGDHGDVTYPVAVTIPPGGSIVAPVDFVPTEHALTLLDLRLEGNFDPVDVSLQGLGGSQGDPYLHVVILADPVSVDYDGDGSVDVLLEGHGSHTHELGHDLAAFEWREGTTVLGSTADIVTPLSIGQHTVTLEIWDDNVPPRSLSDDVTIGIYPPTQVPGVLTHYYDAGQSDPTPLLDAVPANADFVELRAGLDVASESGIGGSGYTKDVLVTQKARFAVALEEQYVFTAVGGVDQRLFVDGAPVTGPLTMTVGNHTIEARWAVADVSELPLQVLVSRGGGPSDELDPELLSHDQTNLVPVINSMPAQGTDLGGNQIVLTGLGFFPESSVVVHWGGIDLTSANFTSWSADAIEFLSPPGSGMISVTVETPAGTSNARDFEYSPTGPVPTNFTSLPSIPIVEPTTADWGPDGRLYVGRLSGEIVAFTFDESYNVVSQTTYPGISGLSNSDLLGLAFDPYDPPSPVKIYVGHGELYAQGGTSFSGPAPYTGQVSVLTGPAFDNPQPLITGLPTSNHDHGVNGMEFDNNGDLLLTVGGNTNAGVIHPNIGDLPESPLSGAILKAHTSRPDFDGAITYVETATGLPNNDQVFGEEVDVAPGTHVEVQAPGMRNPFDIVYSTRGMLYTVDNGPNTGFGSSSTGPDTVGLDPTDQDEVILVEFDNYYGHPNRSRGRYDARQNVYHGTLTPNLPDAYTPQIQRTFSSIDGVVEYRANAFNGEIRGDLVFQRYWDAAFVLRLTDDGRRAAASPFQVGALTGSLSLEIGPGGALIAISYSGDALRVLLPSDVAVNGPTPYEVFPWRAPSTGGQPFVIGGHNLGTPGTTSVTFDGIPATLTAVSAGRIEGTIPAHPSPTTDLVDIVVTVGPEVRVLSDAFRYLFPSPGQEPGRWETGPDLPVVLGEVSAGVVDGVLYVVGEGSDATLAYDVAARTWDDTLAVRPFVGHHHAAEVVADRIYLVGGLNGGDGRVQVYDPSTDTWTLGADMPWGGGSVQTALIDGLIYACGGIVGSSTVDNCAVYDPVADTWTSLTPMPFHQGRNHAAAATDGSRLFVFGGRGFGSGDSNVPANGFADVQIYDPLTDTWETSQDAGSTLAPLPQARGGMGRAVFYRGEFYVFGGETVSGAGAGPNDTYDRVDVYDPVANTWRLEAPMPTARHGVFPVEYRSRMFLAGGGPVVGFSQSTAFEIFTRQ